MIHSYFYVHVLISEIICFTQMAINGLIRFTTKKKVDENYTVETQTKII